MRWNKLRHELVSTDTGYEVVFYIPPYLEEMGDEFRLPKAQTDEDKRKLLEYLKTIYPNLTIQAIKFVTGSVITASILLPAHPKNKAHASVPVNTTAITITMGNYYIKPDVEPFIYKDRVMVPVRAIAEVLGAQVLWDSKARMVEIRKDHENIKLWVGSKWAVSDKNEFTMDVEPVILSGRTMVPIRFAVEAFGIGVGWDQDNKAVTIDYNKEFTLDYIVESGDSLYKIANQFGTTVENIRLWNKISGDKIYAGQFIKVASPSLIPIVSTMDKILIKEYQFDHVLGYSVKEYANHVSSYNSLSKYYNRLTELSTFSHKIQEDGSLVSTYPQKDSVELAKQHNIATTMLIHNISAGAFSKDLGKAVLMDVEKRTRLIDSIYSELKRYGYSGVEIDFENLPPESRQDYNTFLKELSEKLKPEDYTIACALPAKTSDTEEAWLYAYDYQSIGKYADRVLVMSYDQHWVGGAPGPIAAISWVEKVASYAAASIPRSKILLGIAMYGYDWPVNGGAGKSVTVSNINQYIHTYGGSVEWNEASATPYYRYTDHSGIERIVWFENVQSTQYKFDTAKKYGFAGVGMWRLGLEESEFWTGLPAR